jgi:hypothetical protein
MHNKMEQPLPPPTRVEQTVNPFSRDDDANTTGKNPELRYCEPYYYPYRTNCKAR